MKRPRFASPRECLDALEAKVDTESYTAWHADADRRMAAGQEQKRCSECRRWKWADQRCNHFKQSGDPT